MKRGELRRVGFFQERGKEDGEASKGRGHEKAGGKASGFFRQNAGHGRAGDLAQPEDEGDEAEGGERPVYAHVLTHRSDHDGRDRPGDNAVKTNGEIQEHRRQVGGHEEVRKHLQGEHHHETGLPAEPVRKGAEDRAGGEAQKPDPGPEISRYGLGETALLDERRDYEGRVNHVCVSEEKVDSAKQVEGLVPVYVLVGGNMMKDRLRFIVLAAERLQAFVLRFVPEKNVADRRYRGHNSGQDQPISAPAFRTEKPVHKGVEFARDDDGKAASDDHEPRGSPPDRAVKPGGDETHHGYIRRAAPHAGDEIQDEDGGKASRPADEGHRSPDDDEGDNDKTPRSDLARDMAADKHGQEVTDEVSG